MQEVDDLLQTFLGFILTGHILECHAGLLFHINLGLRLAEAAHHAVAAHPAGQHIHQQEHTADHDRVAENHHDHGVVLHDRIVHLHAHVLQFPGKLHHVAAMRQAGVAGFLIRRILGRFLLGHVENPVSLDLHLR